MIGVTGLFSVVVGAIVTYASERYPAYIEGLETAAGFLVLGGFAVAAFELSSFVIA